MTSQISDIKCAKCNVALKGPADPKPDSRIACPTCGEGGTFEQIQQELGEYILEKGGENISDMFSNAFRGVKNVKVTKHPVPKKHHRFIVDLDLH